MDIKNFILDFFYKNFRSFKLILIAFTLIKDYVFFDSAIYFNLLVFQHALINGVLKTHLNCLM